MKLRIATWNVERPNEKESTKQKVASLRDQLKSINADIWIITETNSLLSPGEDFCPLPTDFIDGERLNDGKARYERGENRTTIWSKHRIIQKLATHDPETAVCALFATPIGELIVFGTVLPYHAAGSPWSYRSMGQDWEGQKQWQLHIKSIEEHSKDLNQLRENYPNAFFCFGGDLNQSRDGHMWSHGQWYGTPKGRNQLSELLQESRLECVTEEDFVRSGKLTSQSLIDHICLDPELAKYVVKVEPWEPTEFKPGKANSDHAGVYVDLKIQCNCCS